MSRLSCYFRDVRSFIRVLATVVSLVVLPGSSPADRNPQVVGSCPIGREPQYISVDGNRLYILQFNGHTRATTMEIYDVTTPSNPFLLGKTTYPGWGKSIKLAGNVAYVASESAGLIIFDVSNPAAVRRIGSYKTGESAIGIHIVGNLAYIADGQQGLLILDISNPTSPQHVGTLPLPGEVHDVIVNGHYAYIADRFLEGSWNPEFGALRIVDVSDPTNPQPVLDHPVTGQVWSLALHKGLLYVPGEKLEIYNISNPTNPMLAGSHLPSGVIFIEDDVAVVGALGGFQLVDFLDPTTPRRVGGYQFGGRHVTAVGQLAYAVAEYYVNESTVFRLDVVDLTPKANLERVSSLKLPGSARALALSGPLAYIAANEAGVHAVDISNPGAPVRLGNYPTTHPCEFIGVSENYVAAAQTWHEPFLDSSLMEVIDFSNPTAPTLIGSYSAPNAILYSFVTIGKYAVLGLHYYDATQTLRGRLEFINLHSSGELKPDSIYDTVGILGEMLARGDILYAADSSGLHVLDFSSPPNPVLITKVSAVKGGAIRLAPGESRLYALCSAGLVTLDLSNPADPVVLSTNPISQPWKALVAAEPYIYGAVLNSGVQIYDTTGPLPLQYAGGNSAALAHDIAMASDHLFIAADSAGLNVFQAKPRASAPPRLMINRSGPRISISWQGRSGAILEAASALSQNTSWFPISEQPMMQDNQFILNFEPSRNANFFRLRMP